MSTGSKRPHAQAMQEAQGMIVKERPILFSGPMVRAILAGRKTQTRRVVKPQHIPAGVRTLRWENQDAAELQHSARCPYGVPGDRLWVRETWQPGPDDCVYYRADNDPNENQWKPSIHMPRWASRITLEVVSVRVERVQDIGHIGAKAEGVEICDYDGRLLPWQRQIGNFQKLWDSINGKGSWGSNPWVWVVEFRRVNQ